MRSASIQNQSQPTKHTARTCKTATCLKDSETRSDVSHIVYDPAEVRSPVGCRWRAPREDAAPELVSALVDALQRSLAVATPSADSTRIAACYIAWLPQLLTGVRVSARSIAMQRRGRAVASRGPPAVGTNLSACITSP